MSAELIRRWNDVLGRRTGICLIMPVYNADDMEDAGPEVREMSKAVGALRAEHDVLFTQDGHRITAATSAIRPGCPQASSTPRAISRWLGKGLAGSLPSPGGRGAFSHSSVKWPWLYPYLPL